MKLEDKKKVLTLIVIGIIGVLGIFIIGVKQKAKLASNINVLGKFDVQIKSVNFKGMSGQGESKNYNLENDTLKLSGTLYQPGDSVTYSVIIENIGDIDAKLAKIKTNFNEIISQHKNLNLKYEGLKENSIIKKGDSKNLDVVISLSGEEVYNEGINVDVALDFEFTNK